MTLQEFPHLSWSKPCIGIIICNRFLESATYTCTLLVSLFEKWLLERILFPSHRQLVMCCVLCMWVLYVSSLVIEIYGTKARPHSTTNWSLINSWVKQTKFLSLNTVNTVSCCYSNSFNTWDTNLSMMVTQSQWSYIVYRMVIVEGRCDQLTLSLLHTYIIIGWHKSIVSSDWSDTMVWFGQILLYLCFYHPIYMILALDCCCYRENSTENTVNNSVWC